MGDEVGDEDDDKSDVGVVTLHIQGEIARPPGSSGRFQGAIYGAEINLREKRWEGEREGASCYLRWFGRKAGSLQMVELGVDKSGCCPRGI